MQANIYWKRSETVPGAGEAVRRMASRLQASRESRDKYWLAGMCDAVKAMRGELLAHAEAAELEARLPITLGSWPCPQTEVDQLEHECTVMAGMMQDMECALAEAAAEDRAQIEQCCKRMVELLALLEDHQRHEDAVLYALPREAAVVRRSMADLDRPLRSPPQTTAAE